MHLFHKWIFIGGFAKEYDPKFKNYGVELYDGYFCPVCGKGKLVYKESCEFIYHADYASKITRLREGDYCTIESFNKTIMELNQKISEKN